MTDAITSTASSYLPASNQLDTLDGTTITHNPACNRSNDPFGLNGSNRTFEYNNAGRLFKV